MPDSRHRRGLKVAAFLFTLLLPIYVLSIGPVVRAVEVSGRPPPKWVFVVYTPLELLSRDTPLKKPLKWYLSLWTE